MIRNNLDELRQARGWTYYELGKRAGITWHRAKDLCLAQQFPQNMRLKTIRGLLDAFGFSQVLPGLESESDSE